MFIPITLSKSGTTRSWSMLASLQNINHLNIPQRCSVKKFHLSNNRYQKINDDTHFNPTSKKLLLFGTVLGSAAAVYYMSDQNDKIVKTENMVKSISNPNEFTSGLPTYGYEEVAKHSNK